MPLQATSGAASYDGFGGGAAAVPNFIEDVFSTYLYTGTDAVLAINNGVDLSGKGGMLWLKARNQNTPIVVFDTNRGASPTNSQMLWTASTDFNFPTSTNALNSFNSNGFTLGADDTNWVNCTGVNFVSWTFRKQPKFFDVVTWSGDGVDGREIPHALTSTPGFVIVKRTDAASDWKTKNQVGQSLVLNNTDSQATGLNPAGLVDGYIGAKSTTTFTLVAWLGSMAAVNAIGGTYVAYVFAHNAGGFGLTGTDNVISCGVFTTDGAGAATVSLGYEPQWLMFKTTTAAGSWFMYDNMRGFGVTPALNNYLLANSSGAENNGGSIPVATSTGFSVTAAASTGYMYVAIRRGPMKVPTLGTSVFIPVSQTGGGTVTTNFPVDLSISTARPAGSSRSVMDRLRGSSTTTYRALCTESTAAEDVGTGGGLGFANNTGYVDAWNSPSYTDIYWNFRRAPSFFDEVCYLGTGANRTVTHNLGVVPELMIIKSRTATWNWAVYHSALGNTKFTLLDSDGGPVTQSTVWNDTSPTSSVFTVGSAGYTNASAGNYVAYLFATCAGVSKVGSYTGTGTTLQIDCGFTSGARFVLIKRSQDGFSGDWYVWDSARGIVAGNDPYLLLNSTAAEVTNTNYVDTDITGFKVTAAAPAGLNASGGTYIFFAVS